MSQEDIVGRFDGLFFVDQNSQTSVLITCFTSVLADSMDDDGTILDRGPCGSESLVVSLDVLY